MTRIEWNAVGQRYYETGLDRGVLYPHGGWPVPWNGLTSVDETGGDGAATYYIDGRPFLHLPKPKEYAATIKAYTYPDAFSEIMGLVEAADGMFLDSQQSTSFDLCYRTLVGNDTQGTQAGHKIHLVYNATVVPQSVSRNSISDSMTPTDFAWDIQAVPMKVDGYRPTAHIVIDSRNMASEKLQELENLLYGTLGDPPEMPSPQTVFDILSYGDTIVITDNGDGTWTAEGSLHNIYMIGDQIFQIDNVNAVHHGDGTYTISSTP